MIKLLLFSVLSGILFVCCKKESNPEGFSLLNLSADSVSFDTVFTSVGSITQQIKLINNNHTGVNISSISLAGGTASPFIINIDGSPGPSASNLNIAAGDSLYIFVTVLVRPDAQPRPFILRDSIRISTTGGDQFVQLSAWGQNAHFLNNQVISSDKSWPDDLPYVITGSLTVDSNITLTIQAGVHIYIHANAPVYIDGSLNVSGSDSQRVYFTGDRLDQPYVNYPGSWPGIYFRKSSKDNILNYAVLENGYQTLIVEGPSTDINPKLKLSQSIINNSQLQGLLAIQTSITAMNCLISNCGQNVVIGLGGVYQFEQCTVASYSTNLLSHEQPLLQVSNAGTDGSQVFTSDLSARFYNCIFWGGSGVDDEVVISKQGSTIFNVLFDHSLMKQKNYPANIDSNALILNADPLFLSTGDPAKGFDFHLTAQSPAVDAGVDLGIPIDLDGNPRPVNQPDLGCYERQ